MLAEFDLYNKRHQYLVIRYGLLGRVIENIFIRVCLLACLMRICDSARDFENCSSNNVKPEIAVGNYSFNWNSNSIGIPKSDEGSLRAFIRDLVPHISSSIFQANIDFHASIRRGAKNLRAARHLEDLFGPRIILSRNYSPSGYYAVMELDGRTMISRWELLDINAQGSRPHQISKPIGIRIEWELGELIFDRQGKQSTTM